MDNIFDKELPENVTDVTLGKENNILNNTISGNGDDIYKLKEKNKDTKNNTNNSKGVNLLELIEQNRNKEQETIEPQKTSENNIQKNVTKVTNDFPIRTTKVSDLLLHESNEEVEQTNPEYKGFWGFLKHTADAILNGLAIKGAIEGEKGAAMQQMWLKKDSDRYKELQNLQNDLDSLAIGAINGKVDTQALAPAFIKAGFNQSLGGVAYNIAKGTPMYDLKDQKLSTLEEIAAMAWSFILDAPAFAVGGSAGQIAGKAIAKPIVEKAGTKLINSFVKAGLSEADAKVVVSLGAKKIAPQLSKAEVLLNKFAQGAPAVMSSGTALGLYGAFSDALNQQLQEGKGWNWKDVDYWHSLRRGGTDFLLGSTMGTLELGGKSIDKIINNLPSTYEKIAAKVGYKTLKTGAEIELFSDVGNLLREKDEKVSRMEALKMIAAGKLSKVISGGYLKDDRFKEEYKNKGDFKFEPNEAEKQIIKEVFEKNNISIINIEDIPNSPDIVNRLIQSDDIPFMTKAKLLYATTGYYPKDVPYFDGIMKRINDDGTVDLLLTNENKPILSEKFKTEEEANRRYVVFYNELEDRSKYLSIFGLPEIKNENAKSAYYLSLINHLKSKGIDVSKFRDIIMLNPNARSAEETAYISKVYDEAQQFKNQWINENGKKLGIVPEEKLESPEEQTKKSISSEQKTELSPEDIVQEEIDKRIIERRKSVITEHELTNKEPESLLNPVYKPTTQEILSKVKEKLIFEEGREKIETEETPEIKDEEGNIIESVTTKPIEESDLRGAINDLYFKYQVWSDMRNHHLRMFTRKEIDGVLKNITDDLNVLENYYFSNYGTSEGLSVKLADKFFPEQTFETKFREGLMPSVKIETPESGFSIADIAQQKRNSDKPIEADMNNVYLSKNIKLKDEVDKHYSLIDKIMQTAKAIKEISEKEEKTTQDINQLRGIKSSLTKTINNLRFNIFNDLVNEGVERKDAMTIADLAADEITDNISNPQKYEKPLDLVKVYSETVDIPKRRVIKTVNDNVELRRNDDGTFSLKANHLIAKYGKMKENYDYEQIKTPEDADRVRNDAIKEREALEKVYQEKMKEVPIIDEKLDMMDEEGNYTNMKHISEGTEKIKDYHPSFIVVDNLNTSIKDFANLQGVKVALDEYKNSKKYAEEYSSKKKEAISQAELKDQVLIPNDIVSGKYRPDNYESTDTYVTKDATIKDVYHNPNLNPLFNRVVDLINNEETTKHKLTRHKNILLNALNDYLRKNGWSEGNIEKYSEFILNDIVDRVRNKDIYKDDITKNIDYEEATKINAVQKDNYVVHKKEHPANIRIGSSLTLQDIYNQLKQRIENVNNEKDEVRKKNLFTRLVNTTRDLLIGDGLKVEDATTYAPHVIREIFDRLNKPKDFIYSFESERVVDEKVLERVKENNRNKVEKAVRTNLAKLGLSEENGYDKDYVDKTVKETTNYLINQMDNKGDYKFRLDDPIPNDGKIYFGDAVFTDKDAFIEVIRKWDKNYDIPSFLFDFRDKDLVRRFEEAFNYQDPNPMSYEEMLRYKPLDKLESSIEQMKAVKKLADYAARTLEAEGKDRDIQKAKELIEEFGKGKYGKNILEHVKTAIREGRKLQKEDIEGMLETVKDFFDKNKELLSQMNFNKKVYESFIRKLSDVRTDDPHGWQDVRDLLQEFTDALASKAKAQEIARKEEIIKDIDSMLNPDRYITKTERGVNVVRDKYRASHVSADFLDNTIIKLRTLIHLRPSEVQNRIEEIEAAALKRFESNVDKEEPVEGVTYDGYTLDENIELAMLRQYGALDFKNLDDVVNVYNDIVNVVSSGKSAMMLTHEKLKFERQRLLDEVLTDLYPKDKDGNIIKFDTSSPTIRYKRGKIKAWDGTFQSIMNILAQNAKYEPGAGGKIYSDPFNRKFRVNRASINQQDEIYKFNKDRENALRTILKARNSIDLRNKYRRFFEVKENAITIVDTNGERIGLDLSPMQALKLWLIKQQPESEETFRKPIEKDKFGNKISGMGFDDLSFEELEKFVPQELKEFGKWMTNYMRDYTVKRVNPVFRRLNGVDLPLIDNYFPFTREPKDINIANAEDILNNTDFYKLLATSDHHISRVRSTVPFEMKTDAVSVFNKYMEDQIRYSNWAEPLYKLTVFGNSQVRKAIKTFIGTEPLYKLDWMRRKFAGKENLERNYLLNQLFKVYYKGVLHLSRRVGINQALGLFSYLAAIKPSDLVIGMNYILNPFSERGRILRNIIRETGVYKVRGLAPYDTDFASNAKASFLLDPRWDSKEITKSYKKASIFGDAKTALQYGSEKVERVLSANVRYGDKFPIMVGGGSMIATELRKRNVNLVKDYKEAVKQAKETGENPYKILRDKYADIIDYYETFSENTQQPIGITSASFERAKSSIQVFVPFTSGAMSVERAALSALRDSYRLYKQGNHKDALKSFNTFIILHSLNGIAYGVVANGFRFDWQKAIADALIGNLEAVAIYGKLISFIKNTIFNPDYMQDFQYWSNLISPVLGNIAATSKSIYDTGTALLSQDTEKAKDAAYKASQLITRQVGLPLKQGIELYKDISSVVGDEVPLVGVKDETEMKIRTLLGYPNLDIGVPIENLFSGEKWDFYDFEKEFRREISKEYGEINKLYKNVRYGRY